MTKKSSTGKWGSPDNSHKKRHRVDEGTFGPSDVLSLVCPSTVGSRKAPTGTVESTFDTQLHNTRRVGLYTSTKPKISTNSSSRITHTLTSEYVCAKERYALVNPKVLYRVDPRRDTSRPRPGSSLWERPGNLRPLPKQDTSLLVYSSRTGAPQQTRRGGRTCESATGLSEL